MPILALIRAMGVEILIQFAGNSIYLKGLTTVSPLNYFFLKKLHSRRTPASYKLSTVAE